MRICLLPDNFPPQKGGIASWLAAVADICSRQDEVLVFANAREAAAKFDASAPYSVVRLEAKNSVTIWRFLKVTVSLFYAILKSDSAPIHFDFLKTMLNCLSTLSLKQIATLLIWLKPIAEVQRKNPIDVFYCGKIIPAGLTALVMNFFYGVPYIVFIHGAEFLHHQKRKNERLQMAAIIDRSDRIIVNSKYTREIMIEAGFHQEKISIIHPGADPEVFNPEIDSSAIKNKYNLNNHKIILTVANLEERKGHDLVLQALSQVKSKIPNVKYLIVGDGRHKERLQVLSKQLEVVQNVVFAGKVKESELAACYNCCDVFVMPSRQIDYDVEGFGISFIEASACGKPVIGGDSGGVSEAVVNNVTGYVIDPRNEAELAEKIILLFKDTKLAGELGQNGRLRVEQELTWESSVKKIRSLADAACN